MLLEPDESVVPLPLQQLLLLLLVDVEGVIDSIGQVHWVSLLQAADNNQFNT